MPDPSVLKLAEVPLLVVGRGFRIARDQLNGYFAAHGLKPILGNHFDNDQWHAIMTHFVNRGITCRFRIFLPSLGGFDPSPFVYILEDWVPVLTQRRIDIWGLGRPVPGAFMHLRHVLGASDDIGLYALYCWTQTWQVPELCDRYKNPVECGICNVQFVTNDNGSSWVQRKAHRIKAHGVTGHDWPLPDC